MTKFFTLKKKDVFYRILGLEEGNDKSIYIRQIYFANSKSSYHSNYGKMKPPFEFHQYGANGQLIRDSRNSEIKVFISDYIQAFQKYYLVGLPNETDFICDNDIVVEINDEENESNYLIELFSDKRRDILGEKTVVLIPLRTQNIIIRISKN